MIPKLGLPVRPMPLKFGVGFVAERPIYVPELVAGYRYEEAGRHHNYHVTPENWRWVSNPNYDYKDRYVIDGFSPNMNKSLHVGHIRNLAIAKSLSRILKEFDVRMVAILGCSLGVKKDALSGWKQWTNMVNYNPAVYYDVVLPQDVIITREPTVEEVEKKLFEKQKDEIEEGEEDLGGDFDLPQVWDGPNGPVLVKRSDGRPLYAFYDVVFAQEVGPTHYVTGHEQKAHFASLGLADKHLLMGLVLGSDGKKLKSRTNDSMAATEALGWIVELLGQHTKKDEEQPNLKEIAWNILAWNMLHAARPTNLKFEAEKWVRTESPGMYITYTYARVLSALKCAEYPEGGPQAIFGNEHRYEELSEQDANLLGLAEQYIYYHYKAVEGLDPAPLANFAHDLARYIGAVYEKEKIRDGRPSFYYAMSHALWRLGMCMDDLGMFRVAKV